MKKNLLGCLLLSTLTLSGCGKDSSIPDLTGTFSCDVNCNNFCGVNENFVISQNGIYLESANGFHGVLGLDENFDFTKENISCAAYTFDEVQIGPRITKAGFFLSCLKVDLDFPDRNIQCEGIVYKKVE